MTWNTSRLGQVVRTVVCDAAATKNSAWLPEECVELWRFGFNTCVSHQQCCVSAVPFPSQITEALRNEKYQWNMETLLFESGLFGLQGP